MTNEPSAGCAHLSNCTPTDARSVASTRMTRAMMAAAPSASPSMRRMRRKRMRFLLVVNSLLLSVVQQSTNAQRFDV